MRRHELSDREWYLIEPHTLGRADTRGGTGRGNRLFVTAVFYRTRTGIPWHDLPARFGSWNTIAQRFRRWALAGVRQAVFLTVQEPDYEWVLVDSSTSRSMKRRPAKKSTVQAEALGRSRGGFGTKVHAVVDALGNCLHLLLTPAQDADSPALPALLAALRQRPGAVVCDKAYEMNKVLETITNQGAESVIPPKTTRLDQRAYDQNLYANRNKIERSFSRPHGR